METNLLIALIPVVVVGGPVLAWVIRVEKQLAELTVNVRLIHTIIERRHTDVARGADDSI